MLNEKSTSLPEIQRKGMKKSPEDQRLNKHLLIILTRLSAPCGKVCLQVCPTPRLGQGYLHCQYTQGMGTLALLLQPLWTSAEGGVRSPQCRKT